MSGPSAAILTKNEVIRDDFDLMEKYRDRVLVGLNITTPLHQAAAVQALEPNASSIQDRMLALVEAAARGLRTFGMLCPLLPGIADAQDDVDQLIKFVVDCRAEEIFVEPVNPRGPGLRLCQEALEQNGLHTEADAIARIRRRANWSSYVAELISRVQPAMRRYSDISKLRLLLYPSGLLPQDRERIKHDSAGVVWLG
ncbi:MAG: hypothetical protein LUQ40_07425 [Methanomicrobiales archaeon]|nr:hypothetical protein [Methanomicrobiales archaeon]